ncbi:MAG: hypothetical protein AAF500_06110 [Myxococcota bacterium]
MSAKRAGYGLVIAALLALAALPREAHAQDLPSEPFDATPKGTIGLGLVGAELGLIIPSAAGLNEVWSLTVFPVIGAAGGALTGYFTLDEPGREKGAVAALVVGIAGVLPAILVTIRGVRKEREERWEPQSVPIRSEKEQRAFELAEAGPGLFRRSRSGFRAAMPGLSFGRTEPTTRQSANLPALQRRTEMRLSLASGVF